MIKISFDIDDTLWKIDAKHMRQVPDYDLIQVLRWFYNNGDQVYVWSAGGMDYAKTIVDKLGLTDMVTVISKEVVQDNRMDIAFDDCETNLATVDVVVKREPHGAIPARESPLIGMLPEKPVVTDIKRAPLKRPSGA